MTNGGELCWENGAILRGDAATRLRELPDRSVHACITSPPYYNLRSYLQQDNPDKWKEIGAESTLGAYLAALVAVFAEVRRVLRDDGTLWVVIGDAYNAHPGQRKTTDKAGSKQRNNSGSVGAPSRNEKELKPKDLIGVPFALAFALRADGWYLRSIVPWVKTSTMPESVTDRPGNAVEYVLMLTKREKYFYDTEAVKRAGVIAAGTLGGKASAERRAADGVNSRPMLLSVYRWH